MQIFTAEIKVER